MNVVVAVPIDEGLASFIGKKGSSNGITFYNRKIENDVIVVLFPSQEDEKMRALAKALLLSSQIVLSTANIDKKFGEALVASSLLGKSLLLTDDNNVDGLLKNAGIENYKVVAKEQLLDFILKGKGNLIDEPKRVDIDKAFPVKGIGTVVLGIITKGTLRQHDKLFHTSGKEVMIRSMQSQDEDITTADKGTRIGISLKDIDDDEFRKGDLLTQKQVSRCGRLVLEYKSSGVAKEKMREGKLYGLALNFSYSECIVKKVEGSKLEVELRAKIPAETGDRALLIRNELPRIFASGKVLEATA